MTSENQGDTFTFERERVLVGALGRLEAHFEHYLAVMDEVNADSFVGVRRADLEAFAARAHSLRTGYLERDGSVEAADLRAFTEEVRTAFETN